VNQKERAAVIDELGELQREIAVFRPKLKRAEELQKQVQSWYSSEAPDKSFEADGCRYRVQVGMRENPRRITDMMRVFLHLGKTKFVSLASIALKDLEAVVDGNVIDTLLTEERSGPRSVVTVALIGAFALGKKKAA
jgi:hypothetical protein